MTHHTGFLLTRHARDVGTTTSIELWLATPQGPTQLLISQQRPVFFIEQTAQAQASNLLQSVPHIELRPLEMAHFSGAAVSAVYAPTLAQSQLCQQRLRQQGIAIYETDIRLADRYLMERFIRGSVAFTGTPIHHGHFTQIRDAKCRPTDYIPQLSVVSLDFECSEKGVLYSVGLDSPMDRRVIMVGNAQETDTPIEWVKDEKALIHALVDWFQQYDPDVIIGWNVIDFDFRLLHRRAQWHRIALRIGRGKQTSYFRSASKTQQGFITIPGRVVLYGIDTFKTATYQFRSWSLEAVSQELLGEGKAIHNVHDRMAEINHMFAHDKPSLAKYNLQDCVLVNRLFQHAHLLEFAIQRSRLTGLELDRVGGSVAAFTNLYLPQLHRAGYIAPNLQSEDWQASPGGYVMDSLPGLYDSVLVLDFKSLYPSIIRSFLIDPLGLIEGLKLDVGKDMHQAVPGFRGGQFHRTRHFLPEMIEQLWIARDQAKRDNESAFSQAIKIIMNSFYGVLGSSGCRFFDTRLASSITMRGHEIMKKTRELIESYGYQVIYGDTDSTFVSLGYECTQPDADRIGATLVESINQWWMTHLQDDYQLKSILEIEYENHYRKFLMPTIRGSETGSKKRYAGLLGEGENERMIFKGLESVRTDWTALAQRFQKELYQMIFHDQSPDDYIRDITQRTRAGEFDEELVYRKRLRQKLTDYQRNVPPQVRAARLADEINIKLGRAPQYQNKGSISYVITVNGPEPKEYCRSPLDYDHYIEKQLKPVADAILPFVGRQFDALNAPQLGLF